LFKTITDSYQIDIQEVYIYAILEGIFYTKLITSNGVEEAEIDCTAGDGIALSIVYGCPLYASKEVLDLSGVYINDDGSTLDNSNIEDIDDYEEDIEETPKRVVSIEDLEHMIEDAIRNEEYEIAAEIRDRIEKLKKEGN
jgi:bifunctional DNase/RNase